MVAGSAVALWMIGASGVLIYLVTGLGTLAWSARRAQDVTDRIRLPRGRDGSSLNVRVLLGGPYGAPICFRAVRYTILLPTSARAWSPERLDPVLLHELSHVARRDHEWLVLGRVACALHWCNPLAWMLTRSLAREIDGRCDEAVVRGGVPRTTYARILVDLVAEGRSAVPPANALPFSRAATLAWRVRRVLGDPARPLTAVGAIGVRITVGLLLVTGLACASVRLDPAAGPDASGATTLHIAADEDANRGRPIRVEIVVATSVEAAAELMRTDAEGWFSTRDHSSYACRRI